MTSWELVSSCKSLLQTVLINCQIECLWQTKLDHFLRNYDLLSKQFIMWATDWKEHIWELIKIFSDQVDNATDNHNDNAIFTDEDSKIMITVADLLGVETEKLTQVRQSLKSSINWIVQLFSPLIGCPRKANKYFWKCYRDSIQTSGSSGKQVILNNITQ